MSSTPSKAVKNGRAERRFREAFERLKRGTPDLLPKGAKVTQNNVAKEAGCVASALRSTRFPLLVEEIHLWISSHAHDVSQTSTRKQTLDQRARNRELRERIKALEVQRDNAFVKLVYAESRIIELISENEKLRSDRPLATVRKLRSDGPKGI